MAAFTPIERDLVALALASALRKRTRSTVARLARQGKLFERFHYRIEMRRLLNRTLDWALDGPRAFQALAHPDCVGIDLNRARKIVGEMAQRLEDEAKAPKAKASPGG